jgi:hypothetical protein
LASVLSVESLLNATTETSASATASTPKAIARRAPWRSVEIL